VGTRSLEHPQDPGVPQEGMQGTVTKGCCLYWTTWLVPEGDSQFMAMVWEGGKVGTGILKGLNA